MSRRLVRVVGAGALAMALAGGCSASESSPSDAGSSGGADAGLDTGGPGDGSAGGTDGGGGVDAARDGGAGADAAVVGTFTVVDEPNTACAKRGGSAQVLYAAPDGGGPSSTPVIERLTHVGSRRFAGDVEGFVFFDNDGTNASASKTSVGTYGTAFASEGSSLGAVGSSYDLIAYQRYDGLGNATGAAVPLATGTVRPAGLTLAGGGGVSLALWSDGRLYAAGVDAAGAAAGPAFTIGLPYTTFLSVAAAYNGSAFGVVWSVLSTPVDVESWFAVVSPTGVVRAPVRMATTRSVHRFVALAATPTGYAAAADVGSSGVHVFPIDAAGVVSGPAHRFVGTSFAWGLVSQGAELGLLVNGTQKEPKFRPLSAAGAPLGDWVCLDSKPCDDAALDADGSGYAIVVRTSPGFDDVFVRVDHLGTGP